MPLAATGPVRLTATALTAAASSSALWLVLARLWVEVLARRGAGLDPHPAFARMEALVFGFGVLLYLLSLAISHLIGSFEQAREIERRALEVQVLAREAELQSLRAQIDPHFLFNSLHSISALTATDAAAARRMCVLLADFLRESLTLGAASRIPLGRELSLAGRFLEIERIRFAERLEVVDRFRRGGARTWCRRCCCSRSSRTRSPTAWRTSSRVVRSGWRCHAPRRH